MLDRRPAAPVLASMFVTLAAATAPTFAADAFAPAGGKATLTVEYRYESSGRIKGSPDGVYELREWRSKRSVDLSAALTAAAPTPLPTMQAIDAAQAAELRQAGARVQGAGAQMAPMMASAEAIVAKCGNDEKCIERETMKMGAAMAGTPQVDAALATGRAAAAAAQPGAPRYQAWRATAQTGRYAIEGTSHVVHRDPVCLSLPGGRCTLDSTSKGGGDLPKTPGGRGGPAAVEVDAQAQTLTVMLPVPLGALAYTEIVTTDEPPVAGKGRAGTYPRELAFRTTADGKAAPDKPLTVALKGGWRSQAGEQVVQLKGEGVEGGTLVVKWRFDVQ